MDKQPTTRELILKLDSKINTINKKVSCLDNKIGEIRTELKGTEYDPEKGLVAHVNRNTKAVGNVYKSMEIMKQKQAKREGIIGTLIVVLTPAFTFLINWLKYGRGN